MRDSLTIERREVGGVPVLALGGDLTGPDARRVAAALRSLAGRGPGLVVILSRLDLVDTPGIDALLSWRGPGDLLLAGAARALAEELREQGLPDGVRLVAREADALRALGVDPPAGRGRERRRSTRGCAAA